MSTWRELIAQSFDPPATRPFVNDIRRVDINCDQIQSSGAILLGSWIISRLGCSPAEATQSASLLELRSIRNDTEPGPTVRLSSSHLSGIGIRSVRILARSRAGNGARFSHSRRIRDEHGPSRITRDARRRNESCSTPMYRAASSSPRSSCNMGEIEVFDDAHSLASRYYDQSMGGDG